MGIPGAGGKKPRSSASLKKRKIPDVKLKLYGQTLKQVSTIRYLGMWMDAGLTFGEHIQKVVYQCKKGINIMRCLAGVEFGASN